jgi:hypothetical protein
VLLMSEQVIVQIIGSPVACSDGMKDPWRELADYARRQLKVKFKEGCQLEYYDLFDPACPQLPSDAELPFVIIAGEKFSSGGKMNIPAISKRVAELLKMASSPGNLIPGRR